MLRLLSRTLLSLSCIVLIIVLMSITWCLGARRVTRSIMQNAFKFGACVWGIRVHTVGSMSQSRPLIVVSNHFSYLDLFVLGSKIPAAFTPKLEIRSWPLLGFMCKVSGCLFIDRRPSKTLENKQMLKQAMKNGDIISLFPEGTTSDGTGLLPFRSAYFGLAEETGIPVQPISIIYTKLNGKAVDAQSVPIIGWYGDAYFFPHVSQFLRQKSVEATLVFHAPVSGKDFSSRKALALHCQSIIEQGMREMVSLPN